MVELGAELGPLDSGPPVGPGGEPAGGPEALGSPAGEPQALGGRVMLEEVEGPEVGGWDRRLPPAPCRRWTSPHRCGLGLGSLEPPSKSSSPGGPNFGGGCAYMHIPPDLPPTRT